MATTALYHWTVSGSPVNVLIELPVVDRLRAAALRSESEIGGMLVGVLDGAFTVVSDFEEIESEHRRGIGYLLSPRDERRMASRLEARGRRGKGPAVVGFFRSHRRSGMYLDESDNTVLSTFFRGPQQVALLVRPNADSSATGGFFFWEEGEINRKQSYLQFPMDSRQLEEGDYPLLEPVAAEAIAQELAPALPPEEWSLPAVAAAVPPASAADSAETLDYVPGRAIPKDATPAELAELNPPLPASGQALPPKPSPPRTRAEGRASRLSWSAIGFIAAAAAVAGYLLGTAGNHGDRFGQRAGDIALNTDPTPPPPAPVRPSVNTAAPAAAPAEANAEIPAATPPPATPAKATVPVVPKPKPVVTAVLRPVTSPVRTPTPASVPAPSPAPATVSDAHAPVPPPDAATAKNDSAHPPAFPWSHYAAGAEQPKPEPAAAASVSVEPVESGALKRAAHRIPLFGSIGGQYRGGDDFSPPHVVSSFAPKVPRDLARGLTGTLPVDLKLKIDKSGHVSSVELVSKQASPEFTQLAGDAAYNWQFEPAHVKDKNVSSEVIAHFRFRPVM